jgi:predicted GNAT family N-acyltransferase
VLTAYETGEPMATVQVGGWAALGEAARGIRQAVFVEEQRIPAELVCDEADTTAVHAVAFNRLGMPIASGRLLALPGSVGKIGRMATLSTVRGGGLGRQVLQALMQAAAGRGDREIMLHAQGSAVAFYLREGYAPHGDVFQEAGVPHQEMRFALAQLKAAAG